MSLRLQAQNCLCALAVAVAAGLGGCGLEDGVQLNGKIFDAVGLNTGSVKSKEPKMADRAPLVVPPALDKLPEPGSGKTAQPDLADVKDYDAAHQTTKEEQERQQAEFCRKNYEPAVQRGDASADSVEGPMGLCRASIFSSIKKWNSGDDEAQ